MNEIASGERHARSAAYEAGTESVIHGEESGFSVLANRDPSQTAVEAATAGRMATTASGVSA